MPVADPRPGCQLVTLVQCEVPTQDCSASNQVPLADSGTKTPPATTKLDICSQEAAIGQCKNNVRGIESNKK